MQIGNSKYELNNIYNEDCLEAMKQIPDKYFELAIVDPPYGIGMGGGRLVILKQIINNLLEMMRKFQKKNTLKN